MGKEARSRIRIPWFAPVVEGGEGGVMGGVQLNGKPARGFQRHDYLFMQLEHPPGLGYFPPGYFEGELSGDQEWWQAFLEFVKTARPQIIKKDSETGALTFEMRFGGEARRGVLFPSAEEARSVQERGDYGFHLSLFLTLARQAHRDEILKVAEAAWAMAVLNDHKEDPAVGDLALRFEKRMNRLLEEAGVADILNVRWVGNTNWAEIRDSMRRYYKALRENPHIKARMEELVGKTAARLRRILDV